MKRAGPKSLEDRKGDAPQKRAKKEATNGKTNGKSGTPTVQTYSKLKVNGIDISVGDSVWVRESTSVSQIGYARVNTIYKHPKTNAPMVNVTWYYTPDDLFKDKQGFFGQAELLTSDHVQDTEVHWIFMKIVVLSFDDYFERNIVDANVYYTRGFYEHVSGDISPDFDEWKRTWICNTIINPDTLYLIWEGCEGLFHENWVEGNADEFNKCINCEDKENNK